MKIAILCPYPLETAPSQRFRYEQYLGYLEESGFNYKVFPFLDIKTNSVLYKRGFLFQKITGILKGFFLRMLQLPQLLSFDFVFIHRESSPLGPPLFEWIIAKLFKKKIIYDFDDAIWKNQSGNNPVLIRWIKNPSKVNLLMKWSYKVSGGNQYLCDYAKKFSKNVVYNPTTIDTENYHNKIKNQYTGKLIIGWTGSHSTLTYLYPIIPIIEKLQRKYDFEFMVICNRKPKTELKSMLFIPWNKNSEINDLLQFDIGLMPLQEDEWTLGKCGFKALQYMALGIPVLLSPIGVNKEIVTDGKDGYWCENEESWINHLSILIESEATRVEMGKRARKTVEDRYSVKSNKKNFINLFS
jgi:glycosyltransferase involved in cell wall biosynthesis